MGGAGGVPQLLQTSNSLCVEGNSSLTISGGAPLAAAVALSRLVNATASGQSTEKYMPSAIVRFSSTKAIKIEAMVEAAIFRAIDERRQHRDFGREIKAV